MMALELCCGAEKNRLFTTLARVLPLTADGLLRGGDPA
jgi:hypothetical protein